MIELTAAGFSAREISSIEHAFTEALVNAVNHGNRQDPSRQVRIAYAVTPGECCIEIQDQGPGFSPEDVADPTDTVNLNRPSGRGLLMMKFEERNAVGGESRILHLDDWKELNRFTENPLASYKFTYKSPPSKNEVQTVQRRTFFKLNGKFCICFIDQFVQPETIEQAEYLNDLSASMENSEGTAAIPLPVGDLIMLNNLFWLHGRAPFEKNEHLHRELMRQRGMFSES